MKQRPAFGLNRFDSRTPDLFARDVARGESLGWDWAFTPASPLLRPDPYVMLAWAGRETSRIGLGVLLDNPVGRGAEVLASSIATVDMVAPGRTMLCLGAGDTAVRLVGKRPARMSETEEATKITRQLLSGAAFDGGEHGATAMGHARPVPVWIAAGGAKTLRMAGRVADGVLFRVGRHPANLATAVEAIRAGAEEAGRDPGQVKLGAILHVVLSEDTHRAGLIARSMGAGFYEYSPTLFDSPGFRWNGPSIEELKKKIWPDFHHHHDPAESGRIVDFLGDDVADAFCAYGSVESVAGQFREMLAAGIDLDIVVPHPVPTPTPEDPKPDFMERFAQEVIPLL